MSAWTNGEVHVVLGPRGLSLHRGARADLVLALAQLGGELASVAPNRLRPLAVDPAAKVAFTVDRERGLIRTPLESGASAALYPWMISVMVPLDHERVLAAYVTGTKARALTSVVIGVPPADPKGKWEREFDSAKPSKVDWPDNLIWEKPIWSRKTRWTTDPELLEIDANRHGFALTDTDSAVVGLVRPELSGFVCILRTPKDGDSTVAATATTQGVLVATSLPSRGCSVLCHFDVAGKLLHHREFAVGELGPITVIDDSVICVMDRREVVVLGLAEFGERARLPLGAVLDTHLVMQGSTGKPGAASKRSFMISAAGRSFHGRMDSRPESWTLAEFDVSTVPGPSSAHDNSIERVETTPVAIGTSAKPAADLSLRIIGQVPGLCLDPHQPNDAWHYRADEPFEIEIRAVSVSGPAETGLWVEVSGAALEQGLFEPVSVRACGVVEVDAQFGPGAKKRLALLDYLVPAGVDLPKDKKVKPIDRFAENPPDTFLTIRLSCRPRKIGSGLTYVRIGFDRVTEGSLMRGRQLTISETGPVAPPPPEVEVVMSESGDES